MTDFRFDTIESAISDIANGKMVIVIDDEDRENEGDLVMAASFVTPDAINFMIRFGKGLVCLPVAEEILERWNLKEMVERNEDHLQTNFTVSIDGAPHAGISTGISASDRAKTIQLFINPLSVASDIVSPGHIFPLRAKKMGVLRRAGHTEAAVDLARLAGLSPAGVICEIIKENGQMARVPDLIEFAEIHHLKIITIQDLIRYRVQKERFIEKIETVPLPTEFGLFDISCYRDVINDKFHLALTKGNLRGKSEVLVRVHSECVTGDVFHSGRCDCGAQLHEAMRMVEEAGSGAILYMKQEGRGIGIANKLKAYKLQDSGHDTVDANIKLGFPPDLRDYGVGAQILLDLGIENINLITNNPTKVVGLEGYGIRINKRVPLVIPPTEHNRAYLKTKSEKMGHML
ncbi:bifunctional 3,4-dihydroxy-2-butanone-4-phosphate synthase/GTP cyclohydrolase II [bacterium]|nr:bifunctional 3,4-dihydroxy-2-butanone-4-phosphate synthase/GTP cyclohydrolase II [bacterium]